MREISKDMLAEIEWIHRQIKTMGKEYDRKMAAAYIGQSIEFIKGALFERERLKNAEDESSK